MSIADKLTTIAENEQRVYDAGLNTGKEYQNNLLWGALTNEGTRTNYNSYFSGGMWDDETFRPTHIIKPTEANSAFNQMKLAKLPKGMVDFSNCQSANIAFNGGQFVELELDLSKCISMNWAFSNLPNLETMTLTFTTASQGTNEPFANLPKLKNLTINGELDFSTSWKSATLLTVESLLSLINALYDYSATTTRPTLTIGSTNLAKLTDAQKAIATQKGWNLA